MDNEEWTMKKGKQRLEKFEMNNEKWTMINE